MESELKWVRLTIAVRWLCIGRTGGIRLDVGGCNKQRVLERGALDIHISDILESDTAGIALAGGRRDDAFQPLVSLGNQSDSGTLEKDKLRCNEVCPACT